MVPHHHLPAAVTHGRADARKKQAHVVIDLRGRCHRRARVTRGVLLANGYRRRDAGNLVDVWLLHALQELPRIGRQRFHVAALAFGIKRVKREAGFSRAGKPGNDGDLVVRNRAVDILQVVDARSADNDLVAERACPHGSGRLRCGIATSRTGAAAARFDRSHQARTALRPGGSFNQRTRADGLVFACAQGSPLHRPESSGPLAFALQTYSYSEVRAPKAKLPIICLRESGCKVEDLRDQSPQRPSPRLPSPAADLYPYFRLDTGD